MENLIEQVITWAEERNLVNGSDLERGTLKLISELGELTNSIDHVDICKKGIGQCLIGMIIICRMREITLEECLKFTKTITDERIADPRLALIMIFKSAGKLADRIYTKKEIKAEIGYLLIYVTALANSLQMSIKECLENAYNEIKDYKWIMFDGKILEVTDERYETAKRMIESRKSTK